MKSIRPHISVAAAFVLCLGHAAMACESPVFQWATLQWEPDRYTAFVFTEGEPGQALRESVDALVSEDGEHVNLDVQWIDTTGQMSEAAREVWQGAESPEMPFAAVRFPAITGIDAEVWSGVLSLDAISLALDSPARTRVASELETGAPAVWLFLGSGDEAKDQAAHDVLRGELDRMAQAIRSGTVPTVSDVVWPDRENAKFPIVDVSRDDPGEAVFRRMLLMSEPDLRDYDEPMAFPVFGRGRALYALVGAGINPDTIAEACMFLTSRCSCVVKELNPGMDLLMTANWDAAAEQVYAESAAATASAVPPEPPPPPPVAGPEPRDPVLSFWWYTVPALGCLFTLLAGATAVMVRRANA